MNESLTSENKRSAHNLVIFAVVVAASGWLVYGVERLTNTPATFPPGMLVWLITPLITVFLLRGFAGDGWMDFGLWAALKGNAIWYVVSLLLYPVISALVLFIGAMFGLISFPNFSLAALVSMFGMGLLFSLVKDILEEFAWRGYLTPKLAGLPLKAYAGYLLTGLIWGSWHIAYWLFILGPEQVRLATGLSLGAFIPLAVLNLMMISIVFGEIRLITNSIWPLVLMHTILNALIDPLIAQGLVKLAAGNALADLVQPVLTPLFFLLVGIWLHERRIRQTQGKISPA